MLVMLGAYIYASLCSVGIIIGRITDCGGVLLKFVADFQLGNKM